MSFIHKIKLVCLTLLLLFPLTNYAASAGDLKVFMSGFQSDAGVVRIALYNNAQAYATAGYSPKGAYRTATAAIHSAQASYTFKNVPFGEYGIKVFHDRDQSGQFHTNLVGKPSQGYGFSNNPPIHRHMPNYAAIKFMFNGKDTQQVIKIKGD